MSISLEQLEAMIAQDDAAASGGTVGIQELDSLIAQDDAQNITTQQQGADLINQIAEPALTIGSSIIAEPIAGVAGIVQAVNPFAEEGAGARAVEATREALTFQPTTEAGQEGLQAVGETLAPVGEAFQAAETFLGEGALDLTGSPLLAAAAATLPTVVAEFLGIASGKGILKASDTIKTASKNRTAFKEQLVKDIKAGKDQDLVKLMVDGAGKIKKDPIAIEAIKQGIDEGVVSAMKASSASEKANMLRQVESLKKARKNALAGVDNRPLDVAGEVVVDRSDAVIRANKQAGRDIDRIANTLEGEKIDINGPVNQFDAKLEEFGIEVFDANGNFKPNFKESTLPPGDRAPIAEVLRQMKLASKAGNPDALAVHKMKRKIDQNVTFGKEKTKISKEGADLLKDFRRGLDGVLDETFPAYDKANIKYKDTIEAIQELQDVAGNKTNLTGPGADRAMGILARRITSNAISGPRVEKAFKNIQETARKHDPSKSKEISTKVTTDPAKLAAPAKKVDLDSNVKMLLLFADELDSRFKTSARTSLGGELEKGFKRRVTQSKADLAAEGAAKVIEKVQRISDKNAIKAIEGILQ